MAAGYTISEASTTTSFKRRLIENQRAELAERDVHLDSALRDSLEEVRGKPQSSRHRAGHRGGRGRRTSSDRARHPRRRAAAARGARRPAAPHLDDRGRGPGQGEALLDNLQRHLQDAVDELRNLAHGIYPPLLMDQGLTAALTAAANRSTLRQIEAASLNRYPTDVEATV